MINNDGSKCEWFVKLLNDTPVQYLTIVELYLKIIKLKKKLLKSMDNPIFEVFYLADAQVLLLILIDNYQKNIHYNIYF